MAGAPLSIFTVAVRTDSTLPARSVLQKDTVCSPSAEVSAVDDVVTGPPSTVCEVVSTPERLSCAANCRTTSVFAHAEGAATVVSGGVLSSDSVTVPVAQLPAGSQ